MNNTLRVPLRNPADAEYRGSYVGRPNGISAVTLTENIGAGQTFDLGFARNDHGIDRGGSFPRRPSCR